FLQNVCGGAFVLWPGEAETPRSEVLAAVPKVELFPKSTWLRLIVVEFGLLVSGLLSLVLYVQASMTRKGFYVAYVLFGVYIFIVEKVRQWHVSRMIRRRMGPLVSSSGSFKAGGIHWRLPLAII